MQRLPSRFAVAKGNGSASHSSLARLRGSLPHSSSAESLSSHRAEDFSDRSSSPSSASSLVDERLRSVSHSHSPELIVSFVTETKATRLPPLMNSTSSTALANSAMVNPKRCLAATGVSMLQGLSRNPDDLKSLRSSSSSLSFELDQCIVFVELVKKPETIHDHFLLASCLMNNTPWQESPIRVFKGDNRVNDLNYEIAVQVLQRVKKAPFPIYRSSLMISAALSKLYERYYSLERQFRAKYKEIVERISNQNNYIPSDKYPSEFQDASRGLVDNYRQKLNELCLFLADDKISFDRIDAQLKKKISSKGGGNDLKKVGDDDLKKVTIMKMAERSIAENKMESNCILQCVSRLFDELQDVSQLKAKHELELKRELIRLACSRYLQEDMSQVLSGATAPTEALEPPSAGYGISARRLGKFAVTGLPPATTPAVSQSPTFRS